MCNCVLSDISCVFLSFLSDISSCGHIWLCRTYLAGTGLPLLVRTAHYDATAFEVTSHRFVKRVRILFRQPLFDVLFWDDLSQCGNTTVTSDTFRVVVYYLL